VGHGPEAADAGSAEDTAAAEEASESD
jgi:hypothetical protein